jgi:ribosomal protein S14
MHKRAFIRTPQEIKPWQRVFLDRNYYSEEFHMPGKKLIRWTAGERRDRETRVLNAWKVAEKRKTLLYSFKNNHFLFKKWYNRGPKITGQKKNYWRPSYKTKWKNFKIFKIVKKKKTYLPKYRPSLLERYISSRSERKQHNDKRRWLIVRRSTLLYQKIYELGRLHSISRSKNTCLFIGKGSTFNRQLFISRQTLRKLTRFGLVSGLISGKRG